MGLDEEPVQRDIRRQFDHRHSDGEGAGNAEILDADQSRDDDVAHQTQQSGHRIARAQYQAAPDHVP